MKPPSHLVRIVRIMDDAVRVPGTDLRFGLDGLLGLLPGGGDVLGAAVSGWIVVEAARLGAPGSVLARMLGNVAVDALGGAVPLLGDLFDLGFKANRRNLALLDAHLADPEGARRGSRRVVAGWTAAVGGLVVGIGVVMALVIRTVASLLAALGGLA